MTRVTLADQGSFEAEVIDPGSWNGFIFPRFTKEQAQKVLDFFDEEKKTYEEIQTGKFVGENIEMFDPTIPNEEWIIEPDEDGLYDIGNGSFVWTREEDEDA